MDHTLLSYQSLTELQILFRVSQNEWQENMASDKLHQLSLRAE